MIDAGDVTFDPASEPLVTEINSIAELRADKKFLLHAWSMPSWKGKQLALAALQSLQLAQKRGLRPRRVTLPLIIHKNISSKRSRIRRDNHNWRRNFQCKRAFPTNYALGSPYSWQRCAVESQMERQAICWQRLRSWESNCLWPETDVFQ